MEFSRQEYWSGLSFSSPGDLHNPGLKLGCPLLQADSLQIEPPGESHTILYWLPKHIVAPKVYSLRLTVGFNPLHLWLQEFIPFLFFHHTSLGVLLWFGPWLCL